MIYWIVGGLVALIACYFMFFNARFGRATNKGIAALVAGQFDQAEEHFQAALKIAQEMKDDSLVIAWLHLSVISSKRGFDEEAIRRAGNAVQAIPAVRCGAADQVYHVFAHIADILQRNGEFDDAVRFRKIEVTVTPARSAKDADLMAGSLIKLARALKEADRPAEALTAYESVCKLPQSANVPQGRMEMASMLKKLGRFDEAEQQFQLAVNAFRKAEGKQEANLAIALSNLGVFYTDRGRFDEAIAVYRESMEMRRKLYGEADARYAVAQNNYSNCLRQAGQWAEAEAQMQSAISVLRQTQNKALANALDTMGSILRDSGQISEAESYYAVACAMLKERANRDDNEYRDFSGRRAEVLEQLGRHEDAAAARDEAQTAIVERKTHRPLAALLDPIMASTEAAIKRPQSPA